MATLSKLPFTLAFGKREGVMEAFTVFSSEPEGLLGEEPAMRLTENQDVYLHFEAPPDFRFTMDGLDIVTIPGEERIREQTYIRPSRMRDTLLFRGEDFPLVPGYYVLTVSGRDRNWYGLLEILPKYLGKQSWQDMGEELVEEIKNLSFDFMRKSIHISRAMEGGLSIATDMLLRFYTISDRFQPVMHVLSELSHTANRRLVLQKKKISVSGVAPEASHVPPQYMRPRNTASQLVTYTDMSYDVVENRFAKAILTKLDRSLDRFLTEIDSHVERLLQRQRELLPYTQNQEYRRAEAAISRFRDYRARALRIKSGIHLITLTAWFEETKNEMPPRVPLTVLCDARYSLLYGLHKNMENPAQSFSVADFYQFQWKRTDKLYELWGFLQFVKALTAQGWELEEGMAVVKEDGRYRLSSLESGTVIVMRKGEEEIHLTYDGLVPAASAETDRMKNPLYTNNAHRQPDLRMDSYRGGLYLGSLVVDFKYRDILYLWQDENRGEGLRRQFNAYRDMNTKFYRNLDEAASLRDSRPVKEVWAVFPREVPGGADEDYSLKFIPLSPGEESTKRLAERIGEYLKLCRQ